MRRSNKEFMDWTVEILKVLIDNDAKQENSLIAYTANFAFLFYVTIMKTICFLVEAIVCTVTKFFV